MGGMIDYREVIPKGVKRVIGWHRVFINEDKVRKMVLVVWCIFSMKFFD